MSESELESASAPEPEFLQTRQSLLIRLKDWDDQESWRDFFNIYWKLIYGVARKSGLSDPEAQDVVQEVVLSVARKMKDFNYDPAIGSFKSWLLLITQRRIADHLRKHYREPRKAEAPPADTQQTAMVERLPDPGSLSLDVLWDAEWKENLARVALERVKNQVSPRQFEIFDQYVIQDQPAETVAKKLGVSCTQVYLAKHRIGSLLKKELERLQTKYV